MDNRIEVTAKWDADAAVWYVDECSVPGVVTEARTLDDLMTKVARMAADLEEDEGGLTHPLPVHLQAFRERLVA